MSHSHSYPDPRFTFKRNILLSAGQKCGSTLRFHVYGPRKWQTLVHLSSFYWPLLYKQVSGFSGPLHLAALASENGNDCWRYRKIKQQSVPFIVPLSTSLKICCLIWFCHWLSPFFDDFVLFFCFVFIVFFFLPLCLKLSWSHYVSIS